MFRKSFWQTLYPISKHWKYLLLYKRDTEELPAPCKLRKLLEKHISKVIIKLIDYELEERENLLEQKFP